jgi:spermidine synthase
MIPWEFLDSSKIPGSREELSLYRRDQEYSIRVDRFELMNSRLHGSEESLAKISCSRVADRASPHILVGGLGMGYTLQAALKHSTAESRITVVELASAVVKWNHKWLADLAGRPLEDPRVSVIENDVAEVLKSATKEYDAVLLDVDNGPEGFTCKSNDWLYASSGLEASRTALRPRGVLSIWSASPDRRFTQRLRRAGFRVEDLRVPAGPSGGGQHTIWIAERPS